MQDTFARALGLKAEQPLGQTCARDVRVSCIQVALRLALYTRYPIVAGRALPLGRVRRASKDILHITPSVAFRPTARESLCILHTNHV